MKAFERQIAGYSAECLAGFFRSTLFPSPFFDQPAPVRGICFASGESALEEACALAEHTLVLGTILIRVGDISPDSWRDILQVLSSPQLTLSRVALIVPDIDRVAPVVQEKIANALLEKTPEVSWLVTVADHRNLDARLKLALLVYLGLGPNGRMRFLSQSRQRLMIDGGSLLQKP